jgi:hypothetical protein
MSEGKVEKDHHKKEPYYLKHTNPSNTREITILLNERYSKTQYGTNGEDVLRGKEKWTRNL